MLNVFFTTDVEIWCNGWSDLDKKFPNAFRQHIYGTTPKGDFGLPYQMRVLNDHGLKGVFFVEPLFALRFGTQPLAEVIGLINDARHEVQLHLHTEWVDELQQSLFAGVSEKRQHLFHYSLAEQTTLIKEGIRLIKEAGASDINAFRAGSFGFNADTMSALAANGIPFDSSYNASQYGLESGVAPGVTVVEPLLWNGVVEIPMTVFNDQTRLLRHTQLAACSFAEFEYLLWQALEQGRSSFNILSHGFELIDRHSNCPATFAINRFHKLCKFLEKHREEFNTIGFHGLKPTVKPRQPPPLTSSLWLTGTRMLEQACSRIY